MQKLLCVLMFGMVFGQTKLETREYIVDINLEFDNINIKDLTNTNLPYYSVRIYTESMYPDGMSGSCRFQVGNIFNRYIEFGDYIKGTTTNNSTKNSIVEDLFLFGNIEGDYGARIEFSSIYNTDCGIETVHFWVTANFPQEDTGYIEDGFDYCLHTGANLVSSPCRDEVAIESAIPSDILQNITGIITEGGAASNLGGNWVGSLNGLGGGKGYWVISDIDGCFNYTCSED